jgi:aspartate dehydrogenase
LIGCGAIGGSIVDLWPNRLAGDVELAAVLVRPAQVEWALGRVPSFTRVVTDIEALLEVAPDIVVEAAGHAAVAQYVQPALESGCEVHVLSAGALADDDLRLRLHLAARKGSSRICIPAGALAGFDGLLSLRASGLRSVKYTSTKPVDAWRGTPAEAAVNLDGLRGPSVVFSGTARQAAAAFPKNANLAAAVALAGIGFERTDVELVADPHAVENSACIEAVTADERLQVTLFSAAFAENPRSSRITAMSAIAGLQQRRALIGFH